MKRPNHYLFKIEDSNYLIYKKDFSGGIIENYHGLFHSRISLDDSFDGENFLEKDFLELSIFKIKYDGYFEYWNKK